MVRFFLMYCVNSRAECSLARDCRVYYALPLGFIAFSPSCALARFSTVFQVKPPIDCMPATGPPVFGIISLTTLTALDPAIKIHFACILANNFIRKSTPGCLVFTGGGV